MGTIAAGPALIDAALTSCSIAPKKAHADVAR